MHKNILLPYIYLFVICKADGGGSSKIMTFFKVYWKRYIWEKYSNLNQHTICCLPRSSIHSKVEKCSNINLCSLCSWMVALFYTEPWLCFRAILWTIKQKSVFDGPLKVILCCYTAHIEKTSYFNLNIKQLKTNMIPNNTL